MTKQNPHLIVPEGTKIVTRVEVHGHDGRHLFPKGALGMVVETPAESTHDYRVQFSDGSVVSLTRLEFTIRAQSNRLNHGTSDTDYRGIYLRPDFERANVFLAKARRSMV